MEPTANPKSLYRGDLAQTPLPEVLATIQRYRVPGTVECRRDEEVKRIFIEGGNIIFASSTVTADSLGDRLLTAGTITRGQYDESVRRLAEYNGVKRQGAILVEMRALEPKQLFVAVREQVQSIVWSVFQWDRGNVVFEPGREKHLEFIKLNIPTRQAVLRGVRTVPDPRNLIARIGKKTTVLQRSPEADFTNISLEPQEQTLLDRVDGKRSLFELAETPPLSAIENAKILYGMFALRLISVKEPKLIKVQVRTKSQ